MPTATLHDGSSIDFTVEGHGPAVLISAGRGARDALSAAEALAHGIDPYPGARLSRLLSKKACIVVFDYEAHVFDRPKDRSLTLDNIAHDVLAIAAAAGIDRFGFYGSSWLALVGPHLAAVSERLTGYVMGGFPPLEPPLQALLALARRHHAAVTSQVPRPGVLPSPAPDSFVTRTIEAPSVESAPPSTARTAQLPVAVQAAQARQFITFFADALTQPHITAPAHPPTPLAVPLPRACFVGEDDVLTDAEGNVLISMTTPVLEHRAELEDAGWTVHVLKNLDGLRAAQPVMAAQILLPWIRSLKDSENPCQPRAQDGMPVLGEGVHHVATPRCHFPVLVRCQ